MLHRSGKAKQADGISNRTAVFPGPAPDLFVAESDFPVEAVVSVRHLDRVEILALNVLDQGNFKKAVFGEVLYDNGDVRQSREFGSSQTLNVSVSVRW